MRLNNITSYIFKGKIIDSHTHIGSWKKSDGSKYDTTSDLDVFIKSSLQNGDEIEKVIVSNLDCMVNKNSDNEKIEFLLDEVEGNKRILQYAKDNPKISILAVCQPQYGSVDNIKKLYSENPDSFIGLKFHPEQLKLSADNEAYKPYMEFAKEKKLPCLFHSGNTFDVKYPDGGMSKASLYSKPEQIYNLAREYKDVPVIIAHWGGDGSQNYEKTTELIIKSVKNKDAMLYGDISWVDCNDRAKTNLKNIIKQLKKENALDRVIFGTDAPLGRFGEKLENGMSSKEAYTQMIDDIKNMIKKEFPEEAEGIIDKIFYQNSKKIFFNKETPITIQKPKNKTALYVVVFLGILATGTAILKKGKFQKTKQENKHLSQIA